MRNGVSLAPCVDYEDDYPGITPALNDWRRDAGGWPDLVPLWCPFPQSEFPRVELLEYLRDRKMEPMGFGRTQKFISPKVPDPAWTYQTWLAGDHDDVLDAFGETAEGYGQRFILRLDHEQPLTWSPWGGCDRGLYKDAWAYIYEKMPSNVKLYWCGWGKDPAGMMKYFPGDSVVDYAGFDWYSRTAHRESLSVAWRRPVRWIRSRTDKPIIVGEFGRLTNLSSRGQWISSIRNTQDVWAAIAFDMEVPSENVDWTFTKWMRKRFRDST